MKNSTTTYKNSPLGKIPSDWEVKELGILTLKIGSGITPTGGEKVYRKEGRPFIRSQNVGWGSLILDDIAYLDEITHNSFKSTEIKLNDVFLNITGASIGRSTVADKRVVNGNVNQHVCIIRTKTLELDPYFLNSFFLSQKGQNLIDSYQAGGNRQGLNFEQIKSFKIPLPNLPEQKRIAEVLCTWNEALTKTHQLIVQKDLRKKWLMQQLLTGNKKLKEFSEDWKLIRFKEIYSPRKEKAKTLKYKVLSVTKDGIVAQSEYFKKEIASADTSPYLVIRKGNMVMSGLNFWMGSIDVLTQFNIGMVSPAYKAFEIINPNISEDFMIFFVRSMVMRKALIGSSVQGASIVRRNLDMETLDEWDFHLPSIVEQIAIAKVLQTSDKEIDLLKGMVAKLMEQKKGLMHVLLTGKKRLEIKN